MSPSPSTVAAVPAKNAPYIPLTRPTIDEETIAGVADGWRPTVPAPMNLVSVVHGGIATGDPWLADNATETLGNNVDAFFDAFPLDADGWCDFNSIETYNAADGDLRAHVTGPRRFDYAFDTNDTRNDFLQCR